MIFQIVGLIVLGWLVLAAAVTIAWALFMRGAHRLEADLPTDERGIRSWVSGKAARLHSRYRHGRDLPADRVYERGAFRAAGRR
jgi:hypothetical protein